MPSPVRTDPDGIAAPAEDFAAVAKPFVLWRYADCRWWPVGFDTLSEAVGFARRANDDAAVITGPGIPVEW